MTYTRIRRSKSTHRRISGSQRYFFPLPDSCILTAFISVLFLFVSFQSQQSAGSLFYVKAQAAEEKSYSHESIKPIENLLDIPFSETYQRNSKLPQSCTCIESGVANSKCNIYECGCLCDLTAGKCDPNCCCDTECTTDEIERFENADSCLEDGTSISSSYMCSSDREVSDINLNFPLSYVSTTQRSLDSLLCVSYDNSESRGRYYTDPGYPNPNVFGTARGTKDYSLENYAEFDNYMDNLLLNTVYSKGNFIPIASIDGVEDATNDDVLIHYDLRSVLGGYLPLPGDNIDGLCSEDGSYVQFEEEIIGQTCTRNILQANRERTCHYDLSYRKMTTDLMIGTTPNVKPSSTSTVGTTGGSTGSDFFNVTLNSVTYRDINTNAETAINLATFGETSWDSVTNICSNTLLDLSYTLTYDADGYLKNAIADITVTNLELSATTDTTFVQTYSVLFENENSGAIDTSTDKGNIIARSKSGNPGYLVGKPVLGGFLKTVDSNQAIAISNRGITTLGFSPDGTCANVPTDSTITFGTDQMSGCYLSVTRQELADICNGISSWVDGTTYIPNFLSYNASYVGIFGNADPLDISQWLEIDVQSDAITTLWDDTLGVCVDLPTSINYKFLTTPAGSVSAPQNKIISAQISYTKQTIRWRGSSIDTTLKQRIPFYSTVSFIEYEDTSMVNYDLPNPKLVISLPYDVFYPFYVRTS